MAVRSGPSFSVLLKRYRLAAGLSQESLAELAHLSARAISSYERGVRQAPYTDSLRNMMEALNLSSEERLAFEAAVQRRRPKGSAMRTSSWSNLPPQTTSFIGRKREIAETKRLLERTRLLTLVGAGGCGKTRLALQVAGETVNAYPDGVSFVDLAALSDPSVVTLAIATATGVREEPGHSMLTTLRAALRGRRMLLIIDNCEHLREVCAQVTVELLAGCPHLRILATSRQALGIAAETIRRVPPMTFPNPEEGKNAISLLGFDAVQLFVTRAQAGRASFALNEQNVAAISQVCRQLDGMPLAIELAAARVRVLSAQQIAQRLSDHLQLLRGTNEDVLPRHQTLRATLDWSYALLSDAERALFRRLAVFAGNFNIDAVEAVVGSGKPNMTRRGRQILPAVRDSSAPDPFVLDLMMQLLDKSLLQIEEDGGEARYRLLESVRQYAHDKLVESGEQTTVRRKHRNWYQRLAERAEPELTGRQQGAWLDQIEREYDNIRAAIERTALKMGRRGELVDGLGFAANLLRLWVVRGYLGEGRRLVETLLSAAHARPAARRTPEWMEAVHTAVFVALFQGDFDAMRGLAEQWLAVACEVADERQVWLAHDALARVYMNQGDHVHAEGIFAEQLAVMRRLNYSFGIASALIGLGIVARLQGKYGRSIDYCRACLAETRASGDLWFIGQALSNLGLAYYQLGQYGMARKQFAEALELRRKLRDQSGIAWSLIDLGNVAQAQADLKNAQAAFEEGLAILSDLGDRSGRADALAALGRVAQAQCEFARARAYFLDSLTLRRDLEQRFAVPQLLEDLAGVAAAQDAPVRALTLADAGATLREELGLPRTPLEQERIDTWQCRLQELESAWERSGRTAMTLDEAIAYALIAEELL